MTFIYCTKTAQLCLSEQLNVLDFCVSAALFVIVYYNEITNVIFFLFFFK